MRRGGFEGGYPDGVRSLIAGEIGYGESFVDVRTEIESLAQNQKDALMLMVACDRIWGFFEDRGGVKNGPLLIRLVRDLVGRLGLEVVGGGEDVSREEARIYYNELVQRGAMEFVGELGVKNIFCTIWGMINEVITQSKTE